LIWGHSFIALTLILTGVFDFYHIDIMVVAMIVLFMVFYALSTGPLAWMYVAEVAVDSILSLSYVVLWATVLVQTLTTNFLMDSSLHTYGVFVLFGVS
jgi:hypothetical protein